MKGISKQKEQNSSGSKTIHYISCVLFNNVHVRQNIHIEGGEGGRGRLTRRGSENNMVRDREIFVSNHRPIGFGCFITFSARCS